MDTSPAATSSEPPDVDKRKSLWIAAHVVMILLASLAVILKLCVSLLKVKTFTAVEGFLTAGWILFVVERSLSFPVLEAGGFGMKEDLDQASSERVNRLYNVQTILYAPAICFIRLAILFQLLQIFTTTKQSFRWMFLIGLCFVNTAFYTAFFFINIFQCSPREAIWDDTIAEDYCIPLYPVLQTSGIINVVLDWLMIMLPIVWVWKLQISKSRKFVLTLVFSVGLLAASAGIVRMWAIIHAQTVNTVRASFDVSVWSGVELAAGLIVCAIPSIARLFRRRKNTSTPTPQEHQSTPMRQNRHSGLLEHAALSNTELGFSQTGNTRTMYQAQKHTPHSSVGSSSEG